LQAKNENTKKIAETKIKSGKTVAEDSDSTRTENIGETQLSSTEAKANLCP
jgi:hypothetical protein